MNGYGICFVPMSWAWGRWDKSLNKTMWAFGPIRFVRYRNITGNYGF
jgi:hypothetical protein